MKIILFVNDNFFSYLAAKPLIERHHRNIIAVVFSNKTIGSFAKILDVYRKTHIRYFAYRSFIDMLGRIDRALQRRTVQALAEEYKLTTYRTENVNTDPMIKTLLPSDIGVTLNFDQILKKILLTKFTKGVLNSHASRLPHDKGISPVLWAFARGDVSIWSTIYIMDEGIDTGVIFRQIELPVQSNDTAFSLIAKVCKQNGEALADQIDAVIAGKTQSIGISSGDAGNYWGWPDRQHAAMMKKNRKKFITFREVFQALVQ